MVIKLSKDCHKLRLVGNVLSIKGRGVLMLGLVGKSVTSISTVIKFKDSFLIADDYCNVFLHGTREFIILDENKRRFIMRP